MSKTTRQTQNLNLDNLIKDSDAQDNTDHIREVKHSHYIEADLMTFLMLKKKYPRIKKESFETMCMKQCEFLYNNYTDIYNRLLKDELCIDLFRKFIHVLRQIENGEEDQHSASVIIGTILKELYIDSAIQRENKSNSVTDRKDKKKRAVEKKKNSILKEKYPEEFRKATLTWKDYKKEMGQQ